MLAVASVIGVSVLDEFSKRTFHCRLRRVRSNPEYFVRFLLDLAGCDDRLLWTATRVVDGKTTVSVLSRTVYAFRIPDWMIS